MRPASPLRPHPAWPDLASTALHTHSHIQPTRMYTPHSYRLEKPDVMHMSDGRCHSSPQRWMSDVVCGLHSYNLFYSFLLFSLERPVLVFAAPWAACALARTDHPRPGCRALEACTPRCRRCFRLHKDAEPRAFSVAFFLLFRACRVVSPTACTKPPPRRTLHCSCHQTASLALRSENASGLASERAP